MVRTGPDRVKFYSDYLIGAGSNISIEVLKADLSLKVGALPELSIKATRCNTIWRNTTED